MAKVDIWLALFYLLQICFSICSSFLLLIVILLLRRFDVFHVNLRTLLSQILLCLLVNLGIQSFRPMLPLLQNSIDHSCAIQFNPFPAPFCAFVCIGGVLICMERLYATFNFAKYEAEDFSWILSRIFGTIWILIGLYSLGIFCFNILPAVPKSDYLACRLRQTRINPLKTHWHLLFTLLFYSVFCLVLYVVLGVNKEKQEVYVKFHYSSLSQRFQIAENVKSVRLLLKLMPQLWVAFALLLTHSAWLYSGFSDANTSSNANNAVLNEQEEQWLLLRAESSLLIMPIITSTLTYTVIRSSNVFTSKAKLVAHQLWLQIRHSGQFDGAESSKKLEEVL